MITRLESMGCASIHRITSVGCRIRCDKGENLDVSENKRVNPKIEIAILARCSLMKVKMPCNFLCARRFLWPDPVILGKRLYVQHNQQHSATPHRSMGLGGGREH